MHCTAHYSCTQYMYRYSCILHSYSNIPVHTVLLYPQGVSQRLSRPAESNLSYAGDSESNWFFRNHISECQSVDSGIYSL